MLHTLLTQIWHCLHKVLLGARLTTTAAAKKDINDDDDAVLTVACRCGACTWQLRNPPRAAAAADCHCPPCRHYHTAAFCSYLQVRARDVIRNGNKNTLQSYRHECAHLGTVDRLFCNTCFAKLATKPVNSKDDSDPDHYYYINMGSLQDDSIRADYSAMWSRHRAQWQADDPSRMAPWYPAHPDYVLAAADVEQGSGTTAESNLTLQGGCACGRARYEITHWQIPNHMPHCYCHLCRHSSGAAFLSWIYCGQAHFRWTCAAPPPRCVRTTDMAVRYFCETCSGNVSMVYDEEAARILWPTVGSIDDASWRNVMAQQQKNNDDDNTTASQDDAVVVVGGCADGCFDNVDHIYCKARPLWYALPTDGLPRWDE